MPISSVAGAVLGVGVLFISLTGPVSAQPTGVDDSTVVTTGLWTSVGATTELATTTGLVLSYQFNDDTNGVVDDSSRSALDGALVNADPASAYTSSVADMGKALLLVGAEQEYVQVPEGSALDVSRYTLAALVRYTGVPNDETNGRWEVLEKAGAYWINVRTDGRVRVGGFFGSCAGGSAWHYVDSKNAIPVDTWTHIASRYNGSMLSVWVNGARAGATPVTGSTCANNEPLAVGAKVAPAKGLLEAFWDGRLDDVRIYKRGLSATEIRNLVPS